MKLRDFLKTLNRMVKDHPEYNDLDVISVSDEDTYHLVRQTGTLAKFNGTSGFYLKVINKEEEETPNAIIIN